MESKHVYCCDVTGVLSSINVEEGEIDYITVKVADLTFAKFNLCDLPVSGLWLTQNAGDVIRIKTSTEVSVVDVAEGV